MSEQWSFTYWCVAPTKNTRGTAFTLYGATESPVIKIGRGGDRTHVALAFDRATEAFALARAAAAVGELLEQRAGNTRVGEVSGEPWEDVPLEFGEPTVEPLCRCGKPAEHLQAHPDSAQWACRVGLPLLTD